MDVFTLVGKITIDIQDAMDNLKTVIDKVEELERVLNGTDVQTSTQTTGETVVKAAETATGKAGNALNKWSIMMGNLATQAANKVYDAGKSFLQTGYEFNASMEMWREQLKNMLGLDLEGADAFLDKLHQFAIETPYSMDEVMSNAVELIGNRKVRENTDIIELLTMLGNMSNGDNAAFSSLAKGVMQVFAKGKVQAEEANQQFAEHGVDVYQMLADYFSVIGRDGNSAWTTDDVMDLANNPPTMATAAEFYEAMKYANFSEDGFYYGRMAAMMNTAEGQAQRMHDAYEKAAGAFTSGVFETFATETIPAISDILEKFDKWATENPEALKSLAKAFSDFATNGLNVLLSGLTGLIDFWDQHQGAFKLMTAILGGLLMVTGHPAAGLAMLIASEASGTEGLTDTYVNEDGTYKTNILFPGLSEQMNDSLPQEDKEAGRYHYFSENAREVAESLWDMQRLGLTGQDVSGFEALMAQVYSEFGKIATELGVADTQGGATALLLDLVNQMMTLDKNTENLPDDWFFDPNESEPFRNPLDMHQTDPGILVGDAGGSNSLYSQIAALIQQNATMKQDIMTATQEGVQNGLSGVTITGTVVTSDVRLETGAVVGQLSQKFNFQLGRQEQLAMRGDA